MKYFILAAFFSVYIGEAQNAPTIVLGDSLKNSQISLYQTPEQMEQTAVKMATNNQFVYVTAGNMTGSLSKFEVFYKSHLMEEYGIRYKFFGCMLMPHEANYMTAMNDQIKKRYGADFIQAERAKAKEIFLKQS